MAKTGVKNLNRQTTRLVFQNFRLPQQSKTLLLMSALLTNAAVAEPRGGASKRGTGTKASDTCEQRFQLPDELAKTEMAGTREIAVTHDFVDMVDLLEKHPLMMMSAAQKALAVINHFGWEDVVDPNYKLRRDRVPRLFQGYDLDATGGHYIVGQTIAAARLGRYIAESARGQRGSKSPALMGPPGTGKTVFEEAISHASNRMAQRSPTFAEYTFRWKNLDTLLKDPAIGAKLKMFLNGSELAVTTLNRSPFSLLPTELKQHFAAKNSELASKMLGFDFAKYYANFGSSTVPMDPHAEALIQDYLIPYYKANVLKDVNRAITPLEYLQMLNEFVVIIRHDRSGSQKAPIIRPMESNPDTNVLLGTSNIGARLRGATGALGFHFTGDLALTDGGITIWDDVLRNDPSVLDFLLGVIQENVAKASESPELKLDTLHIFSANHSSMAKANQAGDTGALQSRLEFIPMPLLLHPTQTAETLILSLNPRGFEQRKNGETEFKPLNIKEVFPTPKDGNVIGPDGRYTLRVSVGAIPSDESQTAVDTSTSVEISPHALEFMGMVAAATRVVTDPNLLQEKTKLSGLTNISQRWFTDPIERLRIITGEEHIDRPEVLAELTNLSGAAGLNEGDKGMSQRNLEIWFKTAVTIAQRPGAENTLTPIEVRDALRQTILSDQYKLPNEYVKWIGLTERVATELILPKMIADVNMIISSDGDKVRTNYDSIASELRALAQNPNAQVHFQQGGDQIAIDLKRYQEIKKIFERRFGRPLQPNQFTAFVAQTATNLAPGQTEIPMWNDLRLAIQEWIISNQASDGTYKAYLDYFQGKPVGDQIARDGAVIRDALPKHGYNQRSFAQALRFLFDYAQRLDRGNADR
jgi:predicted Ser/Thr protein kinase